MLKIQLRAEETNRCMARLKNEQRLQRLLNKTERLLPRFGARLLEFLRRPSARIIRIPLGILLVIGGILSFLPVLGIWMLPLGLILLAIDLPILQRPVGHTIIVGQRKWSTYRRKRRR